MTRLAIMSDLHLDANAFGEFELTLLKSILKEEAIDHLHLAGDLSNNLDGVTLPFLEQLKDQVQVSYNLGNHDMLGLSESRIQTIDGSLITLDKSSLIHLAGWYDYSFNPMLSQDNHVSAKQLYWFDRKLEREGSDNDITQDSLKKLDRLLKSAPKTPIVALHVVPHSRFIPKHPFFENFSAFLGSQAFHDCFLKHQVKQVVFGHLHHHHDEVIDGIHYQAHPLGYKREWRLVEAFFKHYPHLLTFPHYEWAKRYRAIKDLPAFQAFYKDNLRAELRQAMTIFDDC